MKLPSSVYRKLSRRAERPAACQSASAPPTIHPDVIRWIRQALVLTPSSLIFFLSFALIPAGNALGFDDQNPAKGQVDASDADFVFFRNFIDSTEPERNISIKEVPPKLAKKAGSSGCMLGSKIDSKIEDSALGDFNIKMVKPSHGRASIFVFVPCKTAYARDVMVFSENINREARERRELNIDRVIFPIFDYRKNLVSVRGEWCDANFLRDLNQIVGTYCSDFGPVRISYFYKYKILKSNMTHLELIKIIQELPKPELLWSSGVEDK